MPTSPRHVFCNLLMRSIAMTDWISYRRPLIGAIAAAAFIVSAPGTSAQPAQRSPEKARMHAGMDKAVKSLDAVPDLKELSPEAKRQLVEFVTGNTLFVVAHELGHGVINEMNI